MGDFALDTQVEGGDGRYSAKLSSDWEIWGPNGGYLAAVALRAAGLEAAIPRPSVFTCHFLGRAQFDVVDLDVRVIRRGRSSELVAVDMTQGSRQVAHALLRTAATVPGLEHDEAQRPPVASPEALRSWEELFPDEDTPRHPFWANLEGKPTDPDVSRDPVARPPVLRQWSRFRPRATFDDPFVDAGRLVLLLDTLGWPAASRPHPNAGYQAPNLDVSVWFHRAEPESTWLLSDHECPVADGGTMGCVGRIWSERGRLLASGGAQLLCMPVPSA